ncbi:L,D-transpeptidase [Demequina lignilytica]|uniref:L,D-transpeptidase n=1 Tax=Demequina lignilytica TaxID=3051663 RepID=A0AAW7M9R9_9MICO|nr:MULTISPECIES: L,D-transpeptidase [unclassified Demequina]MDN4477408.1 L,D-transpeptidase [Demequina sp. SYSU T00039-1]MDN4484152.1 L,D-transpeptidase [Demequina sp. SYSU T0a273]MDN4488241.1 L,D-transpeptidase [Demequina sp. SYSU T00039]
MRVRVLAAVSLGALVMAGCTGTSEPAGTATGGSSTSAQPAISASDLPSEPAEVEGSLIAQASGQSLTVFTAPDGAEQQTVEAADVLTVPDQTPLVFLVKERQAGWVELYLPVRPNGTTGWVPESDVTLTSTTLQVEVVLSDFTLTVTDGDDVIFESSIGLGRDEMPTPGGVYFIRELLQPPDPDGLYGPYAYGLSGYSPVLDSFAGGDAVIGIHGTDDPTSIGRAVSHGCIRLPNDAITALVTTVGLPLGTPVTISE